MKKLLFAVFVISCAVAAFAQQPAHETVSSSARVFAKDGEDVLTRFPSKYLADGARVNIILPAGYDGAYARYPVVYIISDEAFDKARIAQTWKIGDKVIFVSLNMTPGDKAAFLTKEFLPYIETNYKAEDSPQKRILAAAGADAVEMLALLSSQPGIFQNAALLLQDTTPVPTLGPGLDTRLKIYAAGRLSNIARLQMELERGGLKFTQNFVSKIYMPSESTPSWQQLDFRYFLTPADFAAKSIAAYLSADKIPFEGAHADLRLDVKTKAGTLNYIPAELKFSPPFLDWDPSAARLTVIPGATPGKVKISAPLYFYKKGVNTSLQIVE